MVKADETQLSLRLRVEASGPFESMIGHVEREDPRGGTFESYGDVNDEIKRQSRLGSCVDPEIVEHLRAVPLEDLESGLRLFLLFSPAEGKTDRELRGRYSRAKDLKLCSGAYNKGDFGIYARAMEFVARERCPKRLSEMREEKQRFYH